MNTSFLKATGDSGSFRDPTGGVLWVEGKPWRYFTAQGASDFSALTDNPVAARLISEGRLIPFTVLGNTELAEVKKALPSARYLIEHPVIPFISYGYEWPFNMLKDAALLLLGVLGELLEAGFILKDGGSDNVQFINGHPVFIDLGSFEPYAEGAVWAGYNQFCRTFLNPLLYQSATGLPYQPWLRGSTNGIYPENLYRLLSWPARLRRGAFYHVSVQTWLNNMFGQGTDINLPQKRSRTINRSTLMKQVRSLERTIERLRPRKSQSTWLEYKLSTSYSTQAAQAKKRLVEARIAGFSPKIVWDCGCNLGEFSLLASNYADSVIAMDFDPAVVDQLYLRTHKSYPKVLPLVIDMTSPSPDQGWAQKERRGLRQRGPADLILWLALTHHLAISQSIPVIQQVSWIADLTRQAIIEFVPARDTQAATLMKWRSDNVIEKTYTSEAFESVLSRYFTRVEIDPIPDSDRVLYSVSR